MGRRRPPRVTGVVLVDKPAGVTSHDVVQQLRKAFGQSQVGHTGTLDPAATGLMVVTLGRATRIARFLEATSKLYRGTVRLGVSTTTWDGEGETVEQTEVGALDERPVQEVLQGLVGRFEQTVPAYSAIKVDGQRLHQRARRGEVVEGPRRPVHVMSIELLEFRSPDIEIRTEVSKGTYIRSLAVEVGRRLGEPAHLAALRREGVGLHRIEDAEAPARFSDDDPPILSPAEALSHLPARWLQDDEVLTVAQGQPLESRDAEAGTPVRLLYGPPHAPLLAGLATVSSDRPERLAYEVVLVRPEEIDGARTKAFGG